MIQTMSLFKNKTLLFIDDDTITRFYMEEILTMLFGKVMSASNGEKGYKLYKEELPDIILTEIQMPNGDGLNLIKQIRTNDTETPIVLLTSFVEQEILFNTESLSINAYLVKPMALEKLISTLSNVIKLSHK